MTTRPSPIHFRAPRQRTADVSARRAEGLESMAQIVEDVIPKFKKEEERRFYRGVVENYRTAARDILRKA